MDCYIADGDRPDVADRDEYPVYIPVHNVSVGLGRANLGRTTYGDTPLVVLIEVGAEGLQRAVEIRPVKTDEDPNALHT